MNRLLRKLTLLPLWFLQILRKNRQFPTSMYFPYISHLTDLFTVWLHHAMLFISSLPWPAFFTFTPIAEEFAFPSRILFLYPAGLHLIYIFSSSFKGLRSLWLHLLNSGHFTLWSWVFIGRETLCLLALSLHPHCPEMRANHSCPKDFMG